jgi:hypothetical protein
LHLFPPKREVSELVSENNGPVAGRILDEMIASSLSLAKRSWRITATVEEAWRERPICMCMNWMRTQKIHSLAVVIRQYPRGHAWTCTGMRGHAWSVPPFVNMDAYALSIHAHTCSFLGSLIGFIVNFTSPVVHACSKGTTFCRFRCIDSNWARVVQLWTEIHFHRM